jgi:hypothetical protein
MKRKGKSPTGPNKKQKQSQLNFQPVNPVNRVPVITHTTDTDTSGTRFDTDTPPPTISLTSPSPSRVPVSSVNTITKPSQTLSFMTPTISLTTPVPMSDVDTPQPKPVKKQKHSKDDLAGDAQSLAAQIMYESDKESATYEYAQRLDELVTLAALQEMKKFSTAQLTLMAKIFRGQPTHSIKDADPRIDTLTATVRDFLIASRPPDAPYELAGRKKQSLESVPVETQAAATTKWLNSVQAVLERDGFDDTGQLEWQRKKIDKLLTPISTDKATPAEWAQLHGYIFQINRAMAARSNYLLSDVERTIKIPNSKNKLRSVDSVELVFIHNEPEPTPFFCEYKAYSSEQKPSRDFETSFSEQLNDYVTFLSQPDQPCHLRYVFPNRAPKWVQSMLGAAARRLESAGKKLYLTEGNSTTVIGQEQNLFGTPTKASSGIITSNAPTKGSQIIQTPDTVNTTTITTITPIDTTPVISTPVIQPTASRPLMRTKSTPTPVVKQKKTPPKKTPPKKTKKSKEIVGQSKLEAFFPTANVHTPTLTALSDGRPRSTSNTGSKNS